MVYILNCAKIIQIIECPLCLTLFNSTLLFYFSAMSSVIYPM